MMNGIAIRYVCLLILSLLLQTWNYLIRLSQELQLVSVLPRRFMDVGELIPVANFQKSGLWDKKMVPVWMNAKCLLMTVSQECVVNFLVSTRHTYVAQNTLAVVQVMYGVDDTYISVRYHHLIPKSHQLILLNLKYKKTEDNRLNIYIESNDPVISILSTSDLSRLEFKNEVIKEFPQDAIDAVEV